MGNVFITRKGGGGSSSILNGITESYLSDAEEINANTFIDFVTAYESHGESSVLNSTNLSGYQIVCARLDDTHVFVVHTMGTSTTSTPYLYGGVLSVENNNIIMGTDTLICSDFSALQMLQMSPLDENRVAIIRYGSNQGYTMTILSWNGDIWSAITVGTPYVLSRNPIFVKSFNIFDTNKLYILSPGNSNYDYINLTIFNISDLIITQYSSFFINNIASYQDISSVALTPETIAIMYFNRSSTYSAKVSISGTTFTLDEYNIDVDNIPGNYTYLKTCKLTDTTFITFATALISSIYVTINTDTGLKSSVYHSSSKYSNNNINDSATVIKLNHNTIQLIYFHAATTNQKECWIQLVHIIDGAIIFDDAIAITSMSAYGISNYTMGCKISDNKSIAFYSVNNGNNTLLATAATCSEKICLPTTGKVSGLTRTKCTSSIPGDVWILNEGE